MVRRADTHKPGQRWILPGVVYPEDRPPAPGKAAVRRAGAPQAARRPAGYASPTRAARLLAVDRSRLAAHTEGVDVVRVGLTLYYNERQLRDTERYRLVTAPALPPEGYVDAEQACALMGCSRGKLPTCDDGCSILPGFRGGRKRVYYSVTDLRRIKAAKAAKKGVNHELDKD